MYLILGPVFTSVNNGNISVTFNPNYSTNAIRLPYYPNGDKYITLGYITDLGETRQLKGTFGNLIYSSGDYPNVNNIIDSSKNQFLYDYYYGTNNKGLCFDSSTGRVFVSKDILIDNQVFYLELYSYETLQSEQNDIFGGWYYSYVFNTTPSGIGINPNVTSDIDIGWINAFGDLTSVDEVTQENINTKLNELFGVGTLWSGDIFSGDLLGNLGYDTFDNDYSLFLYTIYSNVLDILSSTSLQNQPITFSVHNINMTIYPSDFYIPECALKTFVTTFLITGIIFLLIQQFHSLILTLTVVDVFGLAKSFDRKYTFFM